MRRACRRAAAGFALSLAVTCAVAAHAEEEPGAGPATTPTTTTMDRPRLRFVYRTLNVLRLNPIGLVTDNTVGMRYRLFQPDALLFKDTFVGIALTPLVSPAYARVGALLEVQPIAPMRAFVAYDVAGYFGAFDLFQSFPSATVDFSDSAIGARGDLPEGDALRNYRTAGGQLTVGLDLQIKLGPVAARNLARLVRGDYALRTGDGVFYDQTYDVLAPNRGFFVNNDTDLLWLSDFGLVGGLRANATAPLYGPEHFAPGEAQAHANGPTLRGGPIALYTFFDGEGGIFSKPSVLASVQWYAVHRWRTGADGSALVPYVLIGFTMAGDLRPWK